MMKRSLSALEERQLLDCVKSRASLEARRDYAWMRGLRFSGCRVGEFSRISVGAALMALEYHKLFLPRATRKGGRRDHAVTVTEPLYMAIRDLIRIREEQAGTPIAEVSRAEPLVLNRYRKRLSVRSYQLRMAYWVHEAGLHVSATPHWFRHTLAIAIMRRSQARDPRAIVQFVLDHQDIKTTAIYTGPTREDVDAALAAANGSPRIRKRQARAIFHQHFQPTPGAQ